MESFSTYVANPLIQHLNRIEAHVPLQVFANPDESRESSNLPINWTSDNMLSLTGDWSFKLCRNFEDAERSLLSRDHMDLTPIHVPSNWQLQHVSSDNPIYTNIKYIIPVDPPHVPVDNPCGYYRKTFQPPDRFLNRNIILRFDGVDSCLFLWLNQEFVGLSKDSRLPCEFDMTFFLKNSTRKENIIEVIVTRYSDGFYLEDQDMWNLSGIFRQVNLYSLPNPVHICDYSWISDIDHELNNTTNLKVHVRLRRNFQPALTDKNQTFENIKSDQLLTYTVKVALYIDGELFPEIDPCTQNLLFTHTSNVALVFTETTCTWPTFNTTDLSINLELEVLNPTLWTAEHPFLYTLVISLHSIIPSPSTSTASTCCIQSESCRVGFRTVRNSGQGLLEINNQPITIRGVNLHEHDHVTGHTITPDLIRTDIILMKRHNFNAIRTSHYPHTHWFYDLATIYGMYVIDEANIETHGMKPYIGRLANDLNWKDAFLYRLQRMYQRDKNYACIIGWSLGNESGYGFIHDEMADWIRTVDSRRVLCYEPASYGPIGGTTACHGPHKTATDIICPMYARVEECLRMSEMQPDKPVILCEYSHMMGNSGGNLSDYWAAFRTFPRLQGGFIWDWVDQGISTFSASGTSTWAYGGDYGEIYHDANFCLNGLIWPDRGLGWSDMCLDSSCRGDSVVDEKTMRIDRPSFGLSGRPSTLCQSQRVPALGGGTTSNTLSATTRVDIAMMKPALLEAKQCMKGFDLSLRSVTAGPHIPVTSEQDEAANVLSVSIAVDVSNLLDHTEDITTIYQFTMYLLLDGVIVASTRLCKSESKSCESTSSTGSSLPFRNRRRQQHMGDSDDPATGMTSDLKLMLGTIPSTSRTVATSVTNCVRCPHRTDDTCSKCVVKDGTTVAFRGHVWPETLLLSPTELAYDLIDKNIWACIVNEEESIWSVVVVAELLAGQSWAPAGYPMGFVQLDVTSNMNEMLLSLLPKHETVVPKEAKLQYELPMYAINVIKLPVESLDLLYDVELRADPISSGSSVKSVSAIICGRFGCLRSFRLDGIDMLAHETEENLTAPGPMSACRMHLFRAATDNDKGGYVSCWKATGMDREMDYLPFEDKSHFFDQDNRGGLLVEGRDDDILHGPFVSMTIDSTSRSASTDIKTEISVNCHWKCQPNNQHRNLVDLLRDVHTFVANSSELQKDIPVKSAVEEAFVLQLGATFRMGRLSKADITVPGSMIVHLWKPALFVCTTVPWAEQFAGSPVSVDISSDNEEQESTVRSDTSKTKNNDSQRKTQEEVTVDWRVVYTLNTSGQLSIKVWMDGSRLIAPLPRVGLQLRLQNEQVDDKDMYVEWHGSGPHETYPDRQVSGVVAVHSAPASSLHVPYLCPSENGSRTNISWLQIRRLDNTASMDKKPDIGLRIDSTATSFNFSVQEFATESLHSAGHSSDLRDLDKCSNIRPTMYLNIDPFLMGIGGDDSWTACVHDEFLLPPAIYEYEVVLSAF